MVGQTIAHCGILEGIGQGGRGEVYLAEGTSLKRESVLRIQLQLQTFRYSGTAQPRFTHIFHGGCCNVVSF